ncbi:hypothetical protein BGZ95_009674 [Linnemannia exigua]|uniref:Uncharacterized protein n=1 Tax=Linnemannia exigua TaxID=604196 RepID=A0AAD4DKK2_9FUNG|nr:hypothetical protein BGZ95_009674 [Linnemannia exigua]
MAPKSAAKRRAAAAAAAAAKEVLQDKDSRSTRTSTESAGLPTISTHNTSKEFDNENNIEAADNPDTRDTSPTTSSAGSASISNSSSESLGSTESEGVDTRSRASRKKNQKRREAAKRSKATTAAIAAEEVTATRDATPTTRDATPTTLLTQDEKALFEKTLAEEVDEGESFRGQQQPQRCLDETENESNKQQFDSVTDNVIADPDRFYSSNNSANISLPPLNSTNPVQEQEQHNAGIEPLLVNAPRSQPSPPHTLSESTIAKHLGLDNYDSMTTTVDSPPLTKRYSISHISLLDSNQESDSVTHETTAIPEIQPRRPAASSAPVVHDFPPLEDEIFPAMESEILPATDATTAPKTTEIGSETQFELVNKDEDDNEMTTRAMSVEPNQFHSWSVSTERIVMGAIQCLTESKDMELSYVSLLSAITVLNNRHGKENHEEANGDRDLKRGVVVPLGAEDPLGKLFAQLLGIMMRIEVAEDLAKETMRQGVISPDLLYFRLYMAVENAGFQLQDEVHYRLAQFFFDRQNTEDALHCLTHIELTRWTSPIYRLAISCHLFSTPRHLHEAEILLDQYLAHNKAQSSSSPPSSSSSSRPRRGSRSSCDQDREQLNKSLIQTWFKQQLDTSKWDEIKTQYERRRVRLLDAPSNIERFSASMMDKDYLLSGGVGGVSDGLGHKRGGSSVSRASIVADHGSVASGSSESLAAGGIDTTTTPTIAVEPSVAPPKRSSFSLFSAFRSSKATPPLAPPSVPSIQTRAVNDMYRHQPAPPSSASTVQVNRHLSILDNGMLEECVNHKQFEYGWSIYERMGPLLEDKDTAKILMRLCKRAFLGHGGLGPNLPGSPNVLAKDVYFEDEVVGNQTRVNERGEQTGSGRSDRKAVHEDPEIWEARAWVIYNKAMMNPFFLNSTSNPSNSPTSQTLSPGVTANGGSGALTSPISTMAGTTALSVFLHNILTVAINSQEQSSRYLKAFRIYSTMRNDPLNQYQSQLRDPFVMTCMIKAIYDTVLILVRAQDQQRLLQQQQLTSGQQQRASVTSLAPNQQQQKPPQMTIGPLIDLAFEIYADMRNVGPIRHLPRLSALAPSTPAPKTPQTASQASTMAAGSGGGSGSGSNMSIFFQLSSRTPASTSAAVDLSACGVTAPSSAVSAVPSSNTAMGSSRTTTLSTIALTSPSSSSSPSNSNNNNTLPCILQDLNPTFLNPNIQARRLPSELYLALLHLCIQVPLSGVNVSSQVVKTIVADMISSRPGQQPANLDRHLAAALQFYHDRWMCRTQELKGRKKCQSSSGGSFGCAEVCDGPGESKVSGGEEGVEGELEEVDLEAESSGDEEEEEEYEIEEGGCIFHGWMYRSEEYVLKHMASLTSSNCSSSSDLSSSSNTNNYNTTIDADGSTLSPTDDDNNKDSPLEVAKYDEDLDELDRYLDEKKSGYFGSHHSNSDGGREGASSSEASAANSWMDELDHDTCNGRFYWDMWSREDPMLLEIRFSRRRARMLWRHVSEL